ncbi:hypothetical protein GCM10020219_036530 [Nonomuraea dietziae]
MRAGVARFTFPQGKPGTVLLNTSGSVNGVDDGETRVSGNTVEGWVQTGGFCGPPTRYKIYFHATFDQPVTAFGTWKDGEVRPGASTVANAAPAKVRGDLVTPGDVTVNGPGSGAYLQFDPARPVQMRVGLSYVGIDGARRNLQAEIAAKGLDEVAREASGVWRERLGRVRIGGGTEDQRRTFYSNLYHTMLQPHVSEDVDGTYTGFDHKPHQVRPGPPPLRDLLRVGHLPQPGAAPRPAGAGRGRRHRAVDVRQRAGRRQRVGPVVAPDGGHRRHGRRPVPRDRVHHVRLRRARLRREGGAAGDGRGGQADRPTGHRPSAARLRRAAGKRRVHA